MHGHRHQRIHLHAPEAVTAALHGLCAVVLEILPASLVLHCRHRPGRLVRIVHEGNAVIEAEVMLQAVLTKLPLLLPDLAPAAFAYRLGDELQLSGTVRTDPPSPGCRDPVTDRTAAGIQCREQSFFQTADIIPCRSRDVTGFPWHHPSPPVSVPAKTSSASPPRHCAACFRKPGGCPPDRRRTGPGSPPYRADSGS